MAGWSSPPLVVSAGERKRWGASQLSVLARAHAQCCTCSEGSKSNEQDDADAGTGGSQGTRLGGSLLAVCLWLCWLGWLSWLRRLLATFVVLLAWLVVILTWLFLSLFLHDEGEADWLFFTANSDGAVVHVGAWVVDFAGALIFPTWVQNCGGTVLVGDDGVWHFEACALFDFHSVLGQGDGGDFQWCDVDGYANLLACNGSRNEEAVAVRVLVIFRVYFIPGDWLLS